MNELQVLSRVTRQLAAITTVSDAKDLRDRAEALRRYCKASRAGLKAQNQAAYVKLLCERRAGELLLDVPRKQGKKGGDGLLSMLERSGIGIATADRWQLLARYPEAQLTELVAFCNHEGDELTSMAAIQSAKAYLEKVKAEKAERSPQNAAQDTRGENDECSEDETAGHDTDDPRAADDDEAHSDGPSDTTTEPADRTTTPADAPVRADREWCRCLINLLEPAYELCDLPEFASMRSTLKRWLAELRTKEQSR